MKSCARCGGSYDDAVAFCRADGARLLVAAEASPLPDAGRGGTLVRFPISKRTIAIVVTAILLAAIWHFGLIGAPPDPGQRIAKALVDADDAEARAMRSVDAAGLEIFSSDTHIALGRKQLSHKQHIVLLADNGGLRVASTEDVP